MYFLFISTDETPQKCCLKNSWKFDETNQKNHPNQNHSHISHMMHINNTWNPQFMDSNINLS